MTSTEELDYTGALDWYGLQFAPGGWTLGARPDATDAQHEHLAVLLRRY